MYNYQRLRDLREDRDLKQWQVAEKLMMKQEQYQRYESGKREIPLHLIIELAEFYNVSLDYITGLTNDRGGMHCNYLDPEQKELLRNWELLNSKEKRTIMMMMDSLICKKPKESVKKSV